MTLTTTDTLDWCLEATRTHLTVAEGEEYCRTEVPGYPDEPLIVYATPPMLAYAHGRAVTAMWVSLYQGVQDRLISLQSQTFGFQMTARDPKGKPYTTVKQLLEAETDANLQEDYESTVLKQYQRLMTDERERRELSDLLCDVAMVDQFLSGYCGGLRDYRDLLNARR